MFSLVISSSVQLQLSPSLSYCQGITLPPSSVSLGWEELTVLGSHVCLCTCACACVRVRAALPCLLFVLSASVGGVKLLLLTLL